MDRYAELSNSRRVWYKKGEWIMDLIIENLMKELSSEGNLSVISKSVGGDDKAVKSALGMGLPLLLGSMSNNASKPGGADMLMKMLTETGSSNPVDNISNHLSNPEAAGGSGMVSNLFGSQMVPIQNAISQKTGLPPAAVGKLMSIVTPLIMGGVGKTFMQQKMDSKGLSNLLGEQSKMAIQSSPEAANMAKQLLDVQDGTGGIMGMLKKLLGG
jgi:hypothetical protein